MDVMNLLTGGAVMGNVAQLANANTSSTNGTAFQKQLFSLVGAQQGEVVGQAEAGQLIASVAGLMSKADGSLNNLATAEQLNDMLEKLLDQLEELEQLELGGEHISVVESLLGQIEALIQVISLNSDTLNQSLSSVKEHLQVDGDANQASSYNGVVKLQDQLLMVQQALQSGSMKVLSGQSVEAVISEQLQIVQAKVAELLQDVKLKQAGVQADPNGQSSAASIATKDLKATSGDQGSHLQRISQEATYAQVAAQVKDSKSAPTESQAANEEAVNQPTTSIAVLRADNARELLPHIARTGPAVTSAYVLADEFADTIKGLIVQRFNVTELNGLTEARLSLTPEHLGHVDVKISMQNGVLTAMFQTETAMAKDALENQMLQLRASLASQGITVEKIEVAQSEFASQLNQQQRQHSQGNSSNESNSSRKERDETFEEELLLNATNQELGFGRAVNETI